MSVGIPIPSSATANTAVASSRVTDRQMCPPGGVYFAELVNKLDTTCASRMRSPSKKIGTSGTWTLSSWPCCSITGSTGLQRGVNDLANLEATLSAVQACPS